MSIDSSERLRRWRLILGGNEADGVKAELSAGDAAIDRAMAALYEANAGGRDGARDRRGGLGPHAHERLRDRAALRDRLAAHVDHPRLAAVVEVGELAHQTAACCAARMRSTTACSSPARSSSIGSGSPLTMPSKNSLRSW